MTPQATVETLKLFAELDGHPSTRIKIITVSYHGLSETTL
jgi:hypothetical protein